MKNFYLYALSVLCLFLSTTLLMLSLRMGLHLMSGLFILIDVALCAAIYVQIKQQKI